MPVSFPLLSLAGAPVQGVNEVQRITLGGVVTSGTFDVTYGGQTATIPWNATAAQAQALLVALSSIGAGNMTCTGGPLPGAAIDLHFAGSLAGLNVAQVTCDATNLVGTNPTATPSTVTGGVSGSYRGAQASCLLADTTNGIIYQNTGTNYTPAWTVYTP